MISIMLKSAIVLAVAACIASALRRQSAALRHAIWTAGLIGALVVPLCSVTLPAWQNGFVGWAEHFFQKAAVVESSTSFTSAAVPQQPAATSAPAAPADSSQKAGTASASHWTT